MQINSLNYLIVPPQRMTLTDVTITSVNYNNAVKFCNAVINNGLFTVSFTGDDYDALGQWSDASLLNSVLNKIGATPVTGSN